MRDRSANFSTELYSLHAQKCSRKKMLSRHVPERSCCATSHCNIKLHPETRFKTDTFCRVCIQDLQCQTTPHIKNCFVFMQNRNCPSHCLQSGQHVPLFCQNNMIFGTHRLLPVNMHPELFANTCHINISLQNAVGKQGCNSPCFIILYSAE